MAKRNGKQAACLVSTASTAQAELLRHIAALKLPNAGAYQQWCREQGFGAGLNKNWRQRREEVQRAERLEARAIACAERARHIRELGMQSVEEYAAWCRLHDFSDALRKSAAQKAQEIAVAERERAAQAMAEKRRLYHRPEELIRALYEERLPYHALRTPVQFKLHSLFAHLKAKPKLRDAYLRLLLCICDRDELLSADTVIPYLGPQPGNTIIEGLLRLAERHHNWNRRPEDWKPETHNARRQFRALAHHLLTDYDVPEFMDAAWFEGETAEAHQHREWFLHIGYGQNIRTANIPVSLTKKQAHYFLKSPRYTPIIAAFRRGQALGLGGGEYLAQALMGSRLAGIQPDEPFWATVIQFFVNNPMTDRALIAPLIDYIYHVKFVPQEVSAADGRIVAWQPQEPDFSMKGRAVSALLRRMETWHYQLARETRRRPLEWARCGVGDFALAQREEYSEVVTYWTIQELLSNRELQEEGKAMNNCVASYADSCAQGHSAIWSLRVTASGDGACRRVMTIEVDPARREIVQARGRCNMVPTDGRGSANAKLQSAVDILRRWAQEQNLSIASYVW